MQDLVKNKSTAVAEENKNNQPKGSSMHKPRSNKKRTKYTKLFDMTNVSNKPDVQSGIPTTEIKANRDKLFSRPRGNGKSVHKANRMEAFSKNVAEKTSVEPFAPAEKNKKESIAAEENKSKAKQLRRKTVLTAENYDKEMFKICTAIVDNFLKNSCAENNSPQRMSLKKMPRKSTMLGHIASVDIEKKSVSTVRQENPVQPLISKKNPKNCAKKINHKS